MPRYYGYEESTHFSYWTYDREIVFSSEDFGRQSRSYEDEYDWFTDACAECYDD